MWVAAAILNWIEFRWNKHIFIIANFKCETETENKNFDSAILLWVILLQIDWTGYMRNSSVLKTTEKTNFFDKQNSSITHYDVYFALVLVLCACKVYTKLECDRAPLYISSPFVLRAQCPYNAIIFNFILQKCQQYLIRLANSNIWNHLEIKKCYLVNREQLFWPQLLSLFTRILFSSSMHKKIDTVFFCLFSVVILLFFLFLVFFHWPSHHISPFKITLHLFSTSPSHVKTEFVSGNLFFQAQIIENYKLLI